MSTVNETGVTQKCEKCHGDLVFDAQNQVLMCQKCGNALLVTDQGDNLEKSFSELLMNAPTWQKDASVFQCQHCGAKSIISKFDIVAECDYCGANNINEIKEIPGVRPDAVVLFNLSKEEVQKKVHTWLSKRYFAPNDFKQMVANRQLHGVYFPVFNFDACVDTKYNGIQIVSHTVSVDVDGETVTRTEDFHHPLYGIDKHTFDDVLVLANEKITAQTLKSLQPFDTKKSKPFQQAYLSGYGVSQASKEPTQAWDDAKRQMEEVIRRKIKQQHSGVRIVDLKLDMEITDVKYKYALLPIYVGRTEYKGKKYELYVNGQTGKVYGKTPKSKWKVFTFFATMGTIVAGLGILLAMFL